MSVRLKSDNDACGAAQLATAGPVISNDRSVADMRTVPDDSPAPLHTPCPMCEAPGWETQTTRGEFTAVCGSFWRGDELTYTGPACWMLAHRLDRIEELEFELRVVREGVAA